MAEHKSQPTFWENRYQTANAPWDLGRPAPPLVHFFEQVIAPRTGEIIVLGCGQGQDAVFLAQQGLQVTAVDFAPSAIRATQKLAAAQNASLTALEQDIFRLGASHSQQFDYLFEHTCFCAIAPERRQDYVALAAALLKPNGYLYGIFFTHNRSGGPPWATTTDEVNQLFSPYFEVVSLQLIETSIPQRQGFEHFGVLRRKQ